MKPVAASEQYKEDWMNRKWRPAMGWMYMGVCIFDFIIAPILWTAIQFMQSSNPHVIPVQWQPLTLQGAGLFHMAMGAVLGLAAWGRSQEKMNYTEYYEPPPRRRERYDDEYHNQPPAVSQGGRRSPPPAYDREL